MSERLRKRGRVWYATLIHPSGVREERTTRQRNKDAADAIAREWQRELADPDYAAANQATVSDGVTGYLQAFAELVKVGKRSEATLRFYTQKAGHIVRVFEVADDGRHQPYPLRHVGPASVDDYISRRRREGAHESTIDKELTTLIAVMTRAKRRGLWRGDLDTLIPPDWSHQYVPRDRNLEPEELQKLLAELIPNHAATVAFIVATSADWGPVLRARREDVAPDLSQVFLRGTKTDSRERVVPIVKEWQRSLLAYALEHAEGNDDMLFRSWPNENRDLKVACERAKIERCSPNDLRRTFAHWMRRELVPLELIAPMMGHADTTMLQRVYGRLKGEELAMVVRKAIAAQLPQTHPNPSDPSDEADQKSGETRGGNVSAVGIEPTTRGLRVRCSTS